MRGINKVILIGNLGHSPKLENMPSGDAYIQVSLATNDSWKDKNTGEYKDKTEWHRLVFYRKQAEIAAQYCKKGSKLYIEGRLQTKKYQKNGIDTYTTNIVVTEFQMLDNKDTNTEPEQTSNNIVEPEFSDDIPF